MPKAHLTRPDMRDGVTVMDRDGVTVMGTAGAGQNHAPEALRLAAAGHARGIVVAGLAR